MRTLRSALAGVAALAVAGCATTTFNSTWKNPEAQAVTLHGQKVVALVVTKNEASRRGAEEALARELNKLGGGYWGYGWGAVYDPGYLRTDTIVSVETLVYSLKQDKLAWAGRSETTNPSKADDFIKELTAGVVREMKKVGLIRSA